MGMLRQRWDAAAQPRAGCDSRPHARLRLCYCLTWLRTAPWGWQPLDRQSLRVFILRVTETWQRGRSGLSARVLPATHAGLLRIPYLLST